MRQAEEDGKSFHALGSIARQSGLESDRFDNREAVV